MWTQPNQARIVKWRKWTLRKLKSCFGHEHTLGTNKYSLCWKRSAGNINVCHIIYCCLLSKDQCIKTNNTMDTGFPSAKIHTWSLMCNESSNSFNPLWTTPLPHNDHSPLHPQSSHPLNTKIIHMKASSMEFNTFHMQYRTSLKFWSNGWVVMRTGKVINGSPRLWIHTEVVVLRWSLCWWTWTRGWYGGYDDWAVHFRIPNAYPEWREDWQICPEYRFPTLKNG